MPEIYDIYHDESKKEAYWHGFLFVPRTNRQYLLELLMKARDNACWQSKISFKDIGNRQGRGSPKTTLVKSWLSLGLATLQQQKFFSLPTPFFLGGTPPQYEFLAKPIKCKFVIFKEKNKHRNMFGGMSGLECIETTFRMGIKGGIHKLFDDNKPITIGNVFIDGDEHYIRSFGRSFDVDRSLRRFAEEKRPYVSFLRDSKLIPQYSDHGRINNSQNLEDSHLLQLCDLLIGGIRFHSFCPDSRNIKYQIGAPCRFLLGRDTENYARIKQSRFFNGFSLSEAWLDQQAWKFASLKLMEDAALPKFEQMLLPLNNRELQYCPVKK